MIGKICFFITPYVSTWRKIEDKWYDTYVASFHEVKLHLAEALREKLEEL